MSHNSPDKVVSTEHVINNILKPLEARGMQDTTTCKLKVRMVEDLSLIWPMPIFNPTHQYTTFSTRDRVLIHIVVIVILSWE